MTSTEPPVKEESDFFLYSTAQLAKRSDVPLALLDAVVAREIDPYVEFQMRKKTSGFRTIAVPVAEFKPVLGVILGYLRPGNVHPAAFAYVPGRSVLDCAKVHQGMNWGVKVDIKDFFGSINEDMVFRGLVKTFVPGLRASVVAVLTTRLPSKAAGKITTYLKPRLATDDGLPKRRFKRIGTLPQGSPTSGFLANIVARDFDEEISAFCVKNNLQYTRYSDDIVVSSKADNFDRVFALIVVRFIRETLNAKGFTLNNKKTRVMPPGSRKQVLGLLVDGDVVRLTKEKRASVDATLRGIEVFGLQAHADHTIKARGGAELADSVSKFMHHFWGQVAYVFDVDPKFAFRVLSRLERISEREPFFAADAIGKTYAVSISKLLDRLRQLKAQESARNNKQT